MGDRALPEDVLVVREVVDTPGTTEGPLPSESSKVIDGSGGYPSSLYVEPVIFIAPPRTRYSNMTRDPGGRRNE